jgi:signal peptidase I
MNKPRKWWVSGLLSLLHPGLGQIYNGQARKAVILLLITNIFFPIIFLNALTLYLNTLSLLIFPSVVLVSIGYCIFVISDAVRESIKLNSEYELKKYNKIIVYLGVLLAVIIVSSLMPGLKIDKQKIRNNYLQAYKIPSGSMEPTLLVGDHFLVDRRLSARNPTRGDIIIFEYPEDKTKDFVKRVEAIGGDTVEVRNKELYVNNKHILESQIVHLEMDIIPQSQNPRDNFGPVTVPKDAYFVMGDNRDRAYDSRFWGFVDKSKIKGTVRQIYWSWDRKTSSVRWDRLGRKVL